MVVRPLLALLLVAALFSGCIGDGNTVISARDGLSEAKDAAKKWGDDPELIGLLSFETPAQIKGEDYEARFHIDGEAGDGKAPGWMYLFQSGDRVISIVLAGGLGVLAEGYEADEDYSDVDGTLPKGWIDSTEAAKAVRALPQWPDSDEILVSWELFGDGSETAHWIAYVEGEESYLGFTVNAVSGEAAFVEEELDDVVDVVSPGGSVPEECVAAEDHASGLTSFVAPMFGHSRSIEVGDGAYLHVETSFETALGAVTLSLEDASGAVVQSASSDPVPSPGGSLGFDVSFLPAGEYTAVVSSDTAATNVDLSMQGYWYEC